MLGYFEGQFTVYKLATFHKILSQNGQKRRKRRGKGELIL